MLLHCCCYMYVSSNKWRILTHARLYVDVARPFARCDVTSPESEKTEMPLVILPVPYILPSVVDNHTVAGRAEYSTRNHQLLLILVAKLLQDLEQVPQLWRGPHNTTRCVLRLEHHWPSRRQTSFFREPCTGGICSSGDTCGGSLDL